MISSCKAIRSWLLLSVPRLSNSFGRPDFVVESASHALKLSAQDALAILLMCETHRPMDKAWGMMEAIASHHLLKSQSQPAEKAAIRTWNHGALQQMHFCIYKCDKRWIIACKKLLKTYLICPVAVFNPGNLQRFGLWWFLQRNPRSCDWRTTRIPLESLEYQFPQDQWYCPTLHVSFIARSSWKSRKQHACK